MFALSDDFRLLELVGLAGMFFAVEWGRNGDKHNSMLRSRRLLLKLVGVKSI